MVADCRFWDIDRLQHTVPYFSYGSYLCNADFGDGLATILPQNTRNCRPDEQPELTPSRFGVDADA